LLILCYESFTTHPSFRPSSQYWMQPSIPHFHSSLFLLLLLFLPESSKTMNCCNSQSPINHLLFSSTNTSVSAFHPSLNSRWFCLWTTLSHFSSIFHQQSPTNTPYNSHKYFWFPSLTMANQSSQSNLTHLAWTYPILKVYPI